MYYGNIKENDIANGEGVRTSLFVSGCRHHCPDCFNPETWAFNHGTEFTNDVEEKIIESMKPNHIAGLTVLGGEPMEEENQKSLRPFLKRVKTNLPNKTIWLFTGYKYEDDLLTGGGKHTNDTEELLSLIDVMVDGPFIKELKSLSLKFRGSSNQRVLDMRKSIEAGIGVVYLE